MGVPDLARRGFMGVPDLSRDLMGVPDLAAHINPALRAG